MEEPLAITPPPFLCDYLQKSGETLVGLERILLGKNNRSYHVRTTGRSYFLKAYFRHPHDVRDRLGAEYAFLEFCRGQGIGGVPLPLAFDRASAMALYSWINGAPLKKGHVCSEDIKSAAALLGALARCSATSEAAHLPLAADACTSAWDHLHLAQRRVEALTAALQTAPNTPIVQQARIFVANRLAPALMKAMHRAQSLIELENLHQPLCPGDFIVSPSDFGFHNALKAGNSVVFVDFEYAGRDDPVKTVCDFVCQPEIPVEQDHLKTLADTLEPFDSKNILHRADALLPLHRIKWCCIMLNDFIKLHALRREFSNDDNSGEHKLEMQMRKAESYADTHCVF